MSRFPGYQEELILLLFHQKMSLKIGTNRKACLPEEGKQERWSGDRWG